MNGSHVVPLETISAKSRLTHAKNLRYRILPSRTSTTARESPKAAARATGSTRSNLPASEAPPSSSYDRASGKQQRCQDLNVNNVRRRTSERRRARLVILPFLSELSEHFTTRPTPPPRDPWPSPCRISSRSSHPARSRMSSARCPSPCGRTYSSLSTRHTLPRQPSLRRQAA